MVPVLSRSAAQSAAPQVFVNANKIPATGTYANLISFCLMPRQRSFMLTISRSTAGIPKLGRLSVIHSETLVLELAHLVYAAFFSSTCLSF